MRFVKRLRGSVVGYCENCGQEIEVPMENLYKPYMPEIELHTPVKCACGEYHNLITDAVGVAGASSRSEKRHEDTRITCPKCGSVNLHTGDKGFSLGKAAAGGLLAGPVGLLGGLLGSKRIMITCLNCGHKWQAGKR